MTIHYFMLEIYNLFIIKKTEPNYFTNGRFYNGEPKTHVLFIIKKGCSLFVHLQKSKKYHFLYSLSRKRYCENVKIGPKEVCTEKANFHVFVTNKGISETPTELTSCSLRASVTDVLQKLFAAGREGLK